MISIILDNKYLFELLGIAGFLFYMAAYGLLQLGKISGQSYSYTLMNMAAASLVLLSLIHQFNLASLLIQVAWILISIVGLIRIWRMRRSAHSNGKHSHNRRRSRHHNLRKSRSRYSRHIAGATGA